MSKKTGNKSSSLCLLGALAGDIIGSPYEFKRYKSTDFPLFSVHSTLTDDSILTLAVADAILNDRNYLKYIRKYALAYPNSGYGGSFRAWMYSRDPQPYNSYGNGSAMRVSPVGWAFDTVEDGTARSRSQCGSHPQSPGGGQRCTGDSPVDIPCQERREQGKDQAGDRRQV